MGEGGALPFSLPSFPFSPETPDTQATLYPSIFLLGSTTVSIVLRTLGQSFHKVFSEKKN